ncbi:lamin tail domain-containing protein [Mucisphaera calidilacus]|uniref:LTD domain-containing protein n=1 Tax=Mucisphaera calidilacus TaxID=2527982 RepID=A0A518BXM2_9BACT|nr:lamin tail domain-containing protein [Mucisphaera calidilacus]QDU71704.1 hypothetical protein Pan265_15560 [Mucisphaera calidilacus]
MLKTRSLLALALALSTSAASGQVVINEFIYDTNNYDAEDTNREFVELYNAGNGPVDISGWTLDAWDTVDSDGLSGLNASFEIPAGTTLAAGDFYVMGWGSVPNVDQVLTPYYNTPNGNGSQAKQGLFEDRSETIELYSNTGVLQDAVRYEVNKWVSGADANQIFIPAEVFAEIGAGPDIDETNPSASTVPGGLWSNFQSIRADGNISVSRYIDGHDTNVNGYDFGAFKATPGAPNALPSVPQHVVPDVDGLAEGATLTEYTESWVAATVIDPTVVSTLNPTVIVPSPQGGNAIAVSDSSGGTMVAGQELVDKIDIYAYLETSVVTRADGNTPQESTMFGIGTTDANFNIPDPEDKLGATGSNVNGSTGLAWLFLRTDVDATLYLVDAKQGGRDYDTWDILAQYDLTDEAADWARLSIDAENGVATYNDEIINFDAQPDLLGTFYVGFNEFVDGRATRPATWDMVSSVVSLPGDANGDGLVNLLDLSVLASNFDGTDTPYTNADGDFNGDGLVNLLDLSILATNFETTQTPEPAGAALIGLGALALIRRR